MIRSLKSILLARHPTQGDLIENEIFAKKKSGGGGDFMIFKCHEKIQIYIQNGMPMFVQQFDDPLVPTLHLLHQYPEFLPKVVVDQGATIHLLGGANVMAPGLVKMKSLMNPNLKVGDLVVLQDSNLAFF